jgi:hypothetical protein
MRRSYSLTPALRGSFLALVALGTTIFLGCSLILLGCRLQKSFAEGDSNGTTAAAPLAFSLDTPLHQIAADKQGKAVLDRDLPGLTSDARYPLFDDMNLSQIAAMSGGQITKADLDQVKVDLSKLSHGKRAGQ